MQLTGLSDSHQVVSYDPRGYGKSRPPVRDFPLDFYQRDAADAAALMAALGHESYAVMGWWADAIPYHLCQVQLACLRVTL